MNDAFFYFSKHVKEEFVCKYYDKMDDYTNFFSGLKFHVEKLLSKNKEFINITNLYGFINVYDTESFDKKDMKEAINSFWFDSNLEDHPLTHNVVSALSKFIFKLKSKCISRKKEMCDFLIEVPNFKKNYFQIKQRIKNESLPTHKNDINILLDAHEFAYNNENRILYFITGDNDLFETINKLLDDLCIEKCCYLKDFH